MVQGCIQELLLWLQKTPIISIISCSLRRSIKSRITQRERNTTVTLFLVCFCYFLFVGPMVLVQILSTIFNNFFNQTAYLSIYCLYWFQYSFNFMIYVIRGEQYRKAYMFFLSQVSVTLDNRASVNSIMYEKKFFIVDQNLYLWSWIFKHIIWHFFNWACRKYVYQEYL